MEAAIYLSFWLCIYYSFVNSIVRNLLNLNFFLQIFWEEKFLNRNFFGPKNFFYQKILFDPKYFLEAKSFPPKLFFFEPKILLGHKFFNPTFFQETKFFWMQTSFGNKKRFFACPKILETRKLFDTPNFFYQKEF